MSRRIALVAADVHDEERWGEDRFLEGLRTALEAKGMTAEIVAVLHDESSYEAISDTYARYAALDLSSFDGVVGVTIPGCAVAHPNKVCHLLRTARRFYDMFDSEYPSPSPEHRRVRRHLQELDRAALKEVEHVFVASGEIRGRLLKYLGADSEVLRPSTTLEGLHAASYEFLLLPGRLRKWKRADLIVRAMAYVKSPVELLLCGSGEEDASLKALASGDTRIHFLGRVSDEKLAMFYSRALAVPYAPIGEDFGFVALEAALCEKPVITCVDSGEPARMVYDGRTGFVCAADPKEIGRCIDALAKRPDVASAMGRIGRGSVAHVSWEHVASVLVRSLGFAGTSAISSPLLAGGGIPSPRTLVLDAQPITPANEDGRARTLGLYGNAGYDVRYLGVLEEGGEKRTLRPAPTLEELDIPLSREHLAERDALRKQPGGILALDVSFPLLGHLTPEYAATAERMLSEAHAAIFSRPWCYPLVSRTLAEKSNLTVYDAHTVEGVLRCALMDDGASGTELVGFVGELESRLCSAADLVLTPSHQDRLSLARLYDIPHEKIRVVPNGAYTERVTPASEERKITLKEAEGLTDAEKEVPVAVFMGSASPANVEAAEFILREVAPALPHVAFLIFGSASETVSCPAPQNARLLGVVDEERKNDILSMADVALNPLFSDCGGNAKMFEYMAAGLPVLATPPAARGIDLGGTEVVAFSSRDRFVEDLSALLEEPTELARSGAAGRCVAEERHSWETISRDLGMLIAWHAVHRKQRRPFFSVIVSGYERPKSLSRMARLLSVQTYTDFEALFIDQSRTPWDESGTYRSLDLLYHRIDVKGAARARNIGAFLSRGKVLVFLDDDCEPSPNWLAAARPWFDEKENAGLEGVICSDLGWNDERARGTVARNDTANSRTTNFFVRTEVFNKAGGFDDLRFGEDIEPGLRLDEAGEIPVCRNAWVFRAPR